MSYLILNIDFDNKTNFIDMNDDHFASHYKKNN